MPGSDNILLVTIEGGPAVAEPWVSAFRARLPGWTVVVPEDGVDPARVRHVAAWRHPPGSLAALANLDAIFSLGAGVDHLLADPALPDVPVVRVVDPDLTARMSEYVVLQVLGHHRQAARYREQQRARTWADDPDQRAAAEVRVGVMGLGVLGGDAAEKLRVMGFDVAGWSRTPKSLAGIETFAGDEGLQPFLNRTEILVVLLPATPATRGLLDRKLFAALDRTHGGAALINAGRGALQNEADILACLEDGTLRAATLDVFETEPLPQDSRLWSHPGVTVTPHNSAISSTGAVAGVISRQILAHARGEPLRDVVERGRAY